MKAHNHQMFLSVTLVLLSFLLNTSPATSTSGSEQNYIFGFFKRGAKWTPERTPLTDSLQRGHMANLNRMAEAGKLVGAGPFLDNGTRRGVLIFAVDSMQQVTPMIAEDPAVIAGRLEVELFHWRAPKGIGEQYMIEWKENPSRPDTMMTYYFFLLTPDSLQEGKQLLPPSSTVADSVSILAFGPLTNENYVGSILILDATSEARAKEFVQKLPAVVNKSVTIEYHPWMCAKGVLPRP